MITATAGNAAAARRASGPIRVMICDDSAVIRSALARVLATDPDLEVVARAVDGLEALNLVTARPGLADVLVLDIEMPNMDGLTALPLLLKAAPGLRVIIASTLTTRGASTTLEALRLGAVDYVPKPSAAVLAGDTGFQREQGEKPRPPYRCVVSFNAEPAAGTISSAASPACDRQLNRRTAGTGVVAQIPEAPSRLCRTWRACHIDPAHATKFHAIACGTTIPVERVCLC